MKFLLFLLFAGIPFSFYGCNSNEPAQSVVLVTLDGVRWKEVFHGTDPSLGEAHSNLLSRLTQDTDPEHFILGDREAGSTLSVSNPELISLPAYQNLMAGYVQPCDSNSCGRISPETFPQRILNEFSLNRYQVAVFASWAPIALAAQNSAGGIFVNAGTQAVVDPFLKDPETERINQLQAINPSPWRGVRLDEYTFRHAINYLKTQKPKFLYISLNDSDEWAHQGNYPKYVETIGKYNDWMGELLSLLDQMPEYAKKTTVIITTDHGRGDGENWTGHGRAYPESQYIWLYARGPGVKLSTTTHPHVDIRPTIEATFGLTPLACDGCGKTLW